MYMYDNINQNQKLILYSDFLCLLMCFNMFYMLTHFFLNCVINGDHKENGLSIWVTSCQELKAILSSLYLHCIVVATERLVS